jgi:hypothetical protein
VILFALLVPVMMIAFLFATTALEECLFPRSASEDSTDAEGHHVTGPYEGDTA